MKIIARILGLFALALTVITAVLDITRTIANSKLTMTPLGLEWFNFHVSSLNNFQVGIERKFGLPWVWENIIQNILLAPSWIVFGILTILFLWLSRRNKRTWRERFGA